MSVPYHAHINSNDRVVLPNIKHISLEDLQELVSICQEVSLELPSLEIIRICECPKLRSPSCTHGTINVSPALKMIEGRISWWEALEWEDNDIKQQLQPLFADLYGS
ncbi:putative disease resistance protein [Cinnamomum micranthum f. kanehirae]|uniref:Putative disease resistance protein n=1 Tax=Cinnamomum micranthum f. kanehirae TaxID=337451 RepID=A0A443N0K9_9MAGN|nr:putative disease resistance protein [Cinnamomum micranthum f. kanehirae]